MFEHPLAERHRRARESTVVIALLLTVTSCFLATQVSWSLPQPMAAPDQLFAPAWTLSIVSLALAALFEHEHRHTRPIEIRVYRHGVRLGALELAHDEPLDHLSSCLFALALRGYSGNQRALFACVDGVRGRATSSEPDAATEDHLRRLCRR